MSGQATGWVLRHGPRPEMLDLSGRAYGQRARGLRAVLVTIADAANRDGRHSHPGLPAMIEGSLYGRSQVLALVKQLVADGWVEVEEEGRGRGHATVYGLPRMVRSLDLSGDDKGPVSDEKRSSLDPEKVQSGESVPLSSTGTTVKNNGSTDVDDPKRDPEYGFDRFWDAWPKRNGKKIGKRDALTKWRALSYDDKASAFRGAKNYASASDAGIAGAMDAFRWLEKRRWEDWQEPAVETRANGRAVRTPIADHYQNEFDGEGRLVP